MGRSFYMGGAAFDRFYSQVHDQGGPDRVGDGPGGQVQQVRDPKTGRVLNSRIKARDGFESGLREQDVNYRGDRVVRVGKDFDAKSGRLVEYYQRYGDDGTSRGTVAVNWERTGDGEMTITSSRRVRGI